jgi:large subunit ribosomal protein L2
MRYRAPSFNYVGAARHRKLDHEVVAGVVSDIVHCPGHYAPLCVIKFQNGEQSFMISPEGLRVGDFVKAGNSAPIEVGNTVALRNIPEGTLVCNIENAPGDGGKFVRSSGGSAKVLARTEKTVKIMMPSRREKDFNPDSRATIGVVAGGGRVEKPFAKAGTRHFAKKARNKLYPNVSGVSMNAVDHPYGGKSSHHKGRPTIAPKYAPAGRKVGKIRPRRTGYRR